MKEPSDTSLPSAPGTPVNRGKRTIGLYGGSFNPIHCGHIALAKQLLRVAKLDEVWFVVSPLNPLKANAGDLLADDRRLQMARTALQDEPRLVASDYEFHLPKPSYTWQTLQQLRADCPDCDFILLIGADNWLAFDRWFRHEDILRHYRIIIYPRPGSPIDEGRLPSGVRLAKTPLYDVSSTEIRRRVRLGQSVEGLVPTSITRMVQQWYRP